jgi:RimJ/RimL family protein N-acetyltransferase
MLRSRTARDATSTRVVLRSPTADDRREYVALRRRSRGLLLPWEPHTQRGGLPSPAKVFDRLLLTANTETSVRFLIIERASGLIAGQVSINQIFRGPFKNALLGYWLGEGWTGKGYMTEALALAVAHAFGVLGPPPCRSQYRSYQRPVDCTGEAAGLPAGRVWRSGIFRSQAGTRDHVHWALTAEEWPTKGAKAVLAAAGRAPANRQRPRTT